MPERPAVNASPLICLARSGLVDLLQIAGEEVVVPRKVADEILRRGPDDPTARALRQEPWLVIADVAEIPSVTQQVKQVAQNFWR